MIVLSSKNFGTSGLDLMEEALKGHEKLQVTVVSMKVPEGKLNKITGDLASASFILVSVPIEQFCKIYFRSETNEILLYKMPFFLYHQGLSVDYFLKMTGKIQEPGYAKQLCCYSGSSYTNIMMVELVERLYFAAGSDKNIKLTTKDDLKMFKAYLNQDSDKWLK